MKSARMNDRKRGSEFKSQGVSNVMSEETSE